MLSSLVFNIQLMISGDVNVAYGKSVIGTIGGYIQSIVDGNYGLGSCEIVSGEDIFTVDLGYWYRVSRVHLTMGHICKYILLQNIRNMNILINYI